MSAVDDQRLIKSRAGAEIEALAVQRLAPVSAQFLRAATPASNASRIVVATSPVTSHARSPRAREHGQSRILPVQAKRRRRRHDYGGHRLSPSPIRQTAEIQAIRP
jgi:hypothetical protein